MTRKKREFLDALLAHADPGSAVLRFGSETDDNRQCAAQLGVNEAGQIVVASSGAAIGDVLNRAEGSPVPTGVRERWPQITEDEWDAVLRLATLIFVALEP